MSSNDNIEARLQSQFSDTELDIATSAINQFSEQTGIEKIYFTGLALVFSVEID